MNLFDIKDVVRQAHGVPVLVDSTFATPVLQRPIEMGAAYALHSGTKFLGGHGDVIAGVVACATERAARLRQIRLMTGGLLHPLGGYLLHRGLATLPVRIHRAQETARILASRLSEHRAVTKVFYPGLSGADPRGLIGTQMKGPGTMLAFEIQGNREDAARFITHLNLMTNAVSLGSVDTLIQNPAALTHRVMDQETREAIGISECLFRLSVGLEHPEDLWVDLDTALKKTVGVLGRSSPSIPGA
jgi:cystathionine beta-lyase/cystathionine gamma-synthase